MYCRPATASGCQPRRDFPARVSYRKVSWGSSGYRSCTPRWFATILNTAAATQPRIDQNLELDSVSATSNTVFADQSFASGHARSSGRAAVDDRGDTVWEWQVTTGVFQRDVTEEQIRRLEAPDLKIVETHPAEGPGRWIHDSLRSGTHAVHRPVPRQVIARQEQPRGPLGQLWAMIRLR